MNVSRLVAQVLSVLLSAVVLLPVAARPAERASKSVAAGGVPGALVICGGGSLPDAILDRFVELAGGREARLVVIPTATALADRREMRDRVKPFAARHAASVTLLHARSREEARDPRLIDPLRSATGVWFGGGSQSRLADRYVGTPVERELLALLARGGVIGGTSAGAAIQSRVMIASGKPIPRMATGLDLLPDAIIDQHFLKRARQPRLRHAVAHHPGKFGVGVDEGTALIVSGRTLSVLGRSSVTIILGRGDMQREYALSAGQQEDLQQLRQAARQIGERSKEVAPER